VEDLAPKAKTDKTPDAKTIDGVHPNAAATRADPAMQPLLAEVSELSELCFDYDCIASEHCSNKSGWRLAMLYGDALQGFVVYRFRLELRCAQIAKIAVSPSYRRLGLGSKLVRWLAKKAKGQGLEAVSLSSLKEAVPFYKRLGFKVIPAGDMADTLLPGEELIEDQVYMELNLGARKKK
jgi:GNAT superfamily N-acetyltransferase